MSRDHSEQYVAVSTEPTLQQTTMIRKTNILKTNGIRLYGLIGIILIIGCILAIVLHHVNSSSTYTSASLKFVFMVTRHGARAPLRMYSNDPYKNITKYWPEGMGGLTNLGKQQMYKLGQTFRNMYNGFLNEHYISKEFKAQSTMSERTLMSAATLLAGLYPPKTYQIWSSTINWQPIPVYSTDIDKYYIPTKPYLCPAFWKEQNNSIGKFSIKNSTQQELYDILTKYTGEIVNSIVQVGYIWDALTSEFWNDKKLPDWAQEIFPDKMIHTVIEGFDTFSVKTQTMVQLLVGPLLNLLVSYMSDKINHKLQPDMKMFYHSGHDLTLLGLKKALGINNIGIVNPASSLILELHHSKENNYYVKMLLIEGTKATPEVVETEIPNCVTPCYFDSFVITLSKYLVTDWNKECNLTN